MLYGHWHVHPGYELCRQVWIRKAFLVLLRSTVGKPERSHGVALYSVLPSLVSCAIIQRDGHYLSPIYTCLPNLLLCDCQADFCWNICPSPISRCIGNPLAMFSLRARQPFISDFSCMCQPFMLIYQACVNHLSQISTIQSLGAR